MIDTERQRRLRVSTDGTAGPDIHLPVLMLDTVRALLIEHSVRFWVDEVAISLDGRPARALINLGRDGDAAAVQQLLDSIE